MSAALDRVRCASLNVFLHDHPPQQCHAAEDLWERLDHSAARVSNVERIAGDQRLTRQNEREQMRLEEQLIA